MNEVPRRGRAMPRRRDNLNDKLKADMKANADVTALLTSPQRKDRVNRCSYISPSRHDFCQHYSVHAISPINSKDPREVKQRSEVRQTHTHIKDRHGNESGLSPIIHMNDLKRVMSTGTYRKDEASSQESFQGSEKPYRYVPVFDDSYWQKVNTSEEVDNLLLGNDVTGIQCSSKNIFITNVPRVKAIAEKFSKYKRGNLELRKLDEKVVCVEYDIYTLSSNDNTLKPMQKMRAFFSIKPVDNDSSEKEELPDLPASVKNEFEVLDDDLQKLTDKEIEFIDDKIEENKSYFEDLNRILKRKQVIQAQKNKTSLDLKSLYEMAKAERPPLNGEFVGANFLSKAELQEVKDLILQRCTSSLHGFRRRTIKQEKGLSPGINVISESIMAELLSITKNLNA